MNLHLLRGIFSGLIVDLTGWVRGSIIRGGVTGWEVYDTKTAGQVLVGDGTDITSVPISGDATLASDGTLTVVGLNKVITSQIGPVGGAHFPTVVIDLSGNIVMRL